MAHEPFRKKVDKEGRTVWSVRPELRSGVVNKIRTHYSIIDGKRLVTRKDGVESGIDIIEADWHVLEEGFWKNLKNRFWGVGTIVFTASGRKEQRWERVPKPKKIGYIVDQLKKELIDPPLISDAVLAFDGIDAEAGTHIRLKVSSRAYARPAVSVGDMVGFREPLIVFGRRSPGNVSAGRAGAILSPVAGLVEEIDGTSFKLRPRAADDANLEDGSPLLSPSHFLYEVMDMVQLHPSLMDSLESNELRIEKSPKR